MHYFRENNFPNDEQHKEMMDRTLSILEDYAKRSFAYEKEAKERGCSVNKVIALYIVGGICEGLHAVDLEDVIEKRLADFARPSVEDHWDEPY